MKDMYMKIHDTPGGKIVAACDRELLGQVLDDGKACLDLQSYRGFYEGEPAGEEELESALSTCKSANLVGKRAVGVAIRLKLTSKQNIIYINKTPHIQLYSI